MIDSFHVPMALMVPFRDVYDSGTIWAMLEWCAEFEAKHGRGATVEDFMNERPVLEYRGLFDRQVGQP